MADQDSDNYLWREVRVPPLHLADARAHPRSDGVAEGGALLAQEVLHAEVEAVERGEVAPRVQGLHLHDIFKTINFTQIYLDIMINHLKDELGPAGPALRRRGLQKADLRLDHLPLAVHEGVGVVVDQVTLLRLKLKQKKIRIQM